MYVARQGIATAFCLLTLCVWIVMIWFIICVRRRRGSKSKNVDGSASTYEYRYVMLLLHYQRSDICGYVLFCDLNCGWCNVTICYRLYLSWWCVVVEDRERCTLRTTPLGGKWPRNYLTLLSLLQWHPLPLLLLLLVLHSVTYPIDIVLYCLVVVGRKIFHMSKALRRGKFFNGYVLFMSVCEMKVLFQYRYTFLNCLCALLADGKDPK